MADEVEALRGQFVVEVGVRQAWPFLAFCDNQFEPPRETRLFIGTVFRVGSAPPSFADGDPDAAVAALLELNNRTVTDVELDEANKLQLSFDGGDLVLAVDSEPRHFTGDIWWLAKQRP
jgi:hypothetical protein